MEKTFESAVAQKINWLRHYAKHRLNSHLIDERRCIPPNIVLDLSNQGFFGLQVPQLWGGLGLSYRETAQIWEQLAAIDLTLAVFVSGHNFGSQPIQKFASEAVKHEVLPLLAQGRQLVATALTEPGAGSNVRAISTKAISQGQGIWRIKGEKHWIGTAAWASYINVFAYLIDETGQSQGLTGFLVPSDLPGFRLGPEAVTLGLRGFVQNKLFFEDVQVSTEQMLGKPGQGMRVAEASLLPSRWGIGVMSVGGLKRCLQLMQRYASRRKIATGLLLENPVTLKYLSDLTCATAAIEALVDMIATFLDRQQTVSAEFYTVCKVAGSEFLGVAADKLIQMLGGRGYEENNFAPQILRDARAFRIFEGPTETLTQYLGASVLNENEELQAFLTDCLKAEAISERLKEVARDIKASCLDRRTPSHTTSSQTLFAYSLIGDVAIFALLFASLQWRQRQFSSRPTEYSQHQGCALEWAEQNFETRCLQALQITPAQSVFLDSTALTKVTTGYIDTIGNIEQTLAGEVNSVDPLLQDLMHVEELCQPAVERFGTQTEYPADKGIHQLFEEQVVRTPDLTAVKFVNPGQSASIRTQVLQQLTYRELNERSNQLAHYLQSQGIEAECLIGICTDRSIDAIVSILGVLKAGGAYVPLDPAYPTERLTYMLTNAQVSLLITQAHLLKAIPYPADRVVCVDKDWQKFEAFSNINPKSKVQPNHLAYVIYTSGSTGKPKGVLLQHQGLCNLVDAQQKLFALNPGSRCLQFTSFSFDVSVAEIFVTLTTGSCLYLTDRKNLMFGNTIVKLLRDEAIELMTIPPALLATLPTTDLPDLHILVIGGETCSFALVKQWGKGRRIINCYGPTETTICATWDELTPGCQSLSIGRPIQNTQIYLLDEKLQPVAPGAAGEIYIGGVGLARGYLNRPDLTTQRFIPHLFLPEMTTDGVSSKPRLYKSGDLARYRSDGNLEFLGRIDNQVKIRGFRIELSEIEATLREHPAISEVLITVWEDSPGSKQLIAYLLTGRQAGSYRKLNNQEQTLPTQRGGYTGSKDELSVDQVYTFLSKKLPDYMLPSAYIFLESFPLTPNGKVDRQALPVPQVQRRSEAEYVTPCTPTERQLIQIWGELLSFEAIGTKENFFHLGGNSLLAVQVITCIETVFKIQLSIQQFFDHPTIAELAEHIETLHGINCQNNSRQKSSGTASCIRRLQGEI